MKYLLAIDAGGTKSKAKAYTLDGEEIASAESGPGSPAVVSEEIVWKHIDEAILKILAVLPKDTYQLVYIQMGISAYSIIKDLLKIEQWFSNKYHVPCDIKSDTMIALYAILKDQYHQGVVSLAGTGVAIFAMNKDETCLIGGWGHIIRERGSAYATVHNLALHIIDKMECSIPLNTLEKNWLEYLKANDISDLKQLFYFHSKDEIANHVRYIKKMAAMGDSNAQLLLREEGASLARQVIRAINKLKLDKQGVIGLKGGFVQHDGEYVIEGFIKELQINHIEMLVIANDEEPIIGAYYLAKTKI